MRALIFVIMFMSCKGCLTSATFNNRMTGDYSPVAVSYLLHCKNAANSAPPSFMCSSHNEPRRTERIRIAAIKIVTTSNGFCDIALAPFSERHYPFYCLGRNGRPRLTVMFPGPSSFWPSANLQPASKAPATILLIFLHAARLIADCCRCLPVRLFRQAQRTCQRPRS